MKRSETTETQSNPWDDPAGLSPLTCTFLSPQTNMAVGTVAAPEQLMVWHSTAATTLVRSADRTVEECS
jgi:hypothetical protein